MKTETATFAAGCFWGVEARMRELEGVVDAAVGYMGGTTANPGYEQVCAGDTGHAEVVQLHYDPDRVEYQDLLARFWDIHDPTQLDRQGPDVGSQYRSVVFYHDDAQRFEAERSREEIKTTGRFSRPVVTRIEPAATFWRAEEYHQQYLAKSGGRCSA